MILVGTYPVRKRDLNLLWRDGPHWAEPKVDGWRVQILPGGVIRSREGLDLTGTCPVPILDDLVLDGELYDPAQRGPEGLLSRPALQCVFWDCLPIADYRAGCCNAPIEERREQLLQLGVQCVDRLRVACDDDVLELAREIWSNGGEGIVVKRAGSSWRAGRDQWYKLKKGEKA